jgi:predicted lipid carrier protein YhbT
MNKPRKTVNPTKIVPLPWNKVPLTLQKKLVAKLAQLLLQQKLQEMPKKESQDD